VNPRARVLLVALLLAALTAGVFAPTLRHGFVNYDDREYVLENGQVRAGLSLAGVRWALTATAAGNWHPLAWISHMTDVQLFGLAPAGHHLTSLLLHLLAALLLFELLRRLTGLVWPPALVAALFAVHPLHVESVAWVAERKDVLCGFLWILTLEAYRRSRARPGTLRSAAVVLLFALCLMAKPMAVTLPLTLLLLDFWPLGRFSRGNAGALLREKAPLLALAAASCWVTYAAQEQGRLVKSLAQFPPLARAGNALLAYAAYLGATLWPGDLAVFYPHPGAALRWSLAGVAAAGLLLATTAALATRRRLPWLATGWLWFLGTLLPVIGLVQVGEQARADRYTYIPLVGLFLAAAWTWRELARRRPALGARGPALALLVLAALAWRARAQVATWESSVTLFEHALAVTAENDLALNNLGAALVDAGRSEEAVARLEAAVRLRPDRAGIRSNLGQALANAGRTDEAVAQYREALRIDPGNARVHNNLGVALDRRGDLAGAAAGYREALRLAPGFAEAHNNLGAALARQGARDEALAHFREAVRLSPGYAAARANLERALAAAPAR
jgi:Flp pilus assembly protein TadD